MSKKQKITEMLIDLFDRIGIDTPNNFDEISKFVYKNVCKTSDKKNWNDGDVAFGFREWIESNSKKS